MLRVAEGAQQTHAADAQDDFLAQAVAVVAAIQMVGEVAVGLGVFGQVGVEQEHRHAGAGDALHVEAPGAQRDVATFDAHSRALRHLAECLGRRPGLWRFALRAIGRQVLPEVALAVHERHRHHRQFGVSRRAHRVAGEHTQAAAVGGQAFGEADLHREVGDCFGAGIHGMRPRCKTAACGGRAPARLRHLKSRLEGCGRRSARPAPAATTPKGW